MKTSSRLHLILGITALFVSSVMYSIIQLSNVISIHNDNLAFLNHVHELSETLNNFPESPLMKIDIREQLQTLGQHPRSCQEKLQSLNPIIILNQDLQQALQSCIKEEKMLQELLVDLDSDESYAISDIIMVDTIEYALRTFKMNLTNLVAQIDNISHHTIQLVFWLMVPFSILIIMVSIVVFRHINLNTDRLYETINLLNQKKDENNKLAYYDTLTNIPNRNLFLEILDKQIRNAIRYNTSFSMLYIDLDRFKLINDTLGHDAGDNVIKEASLRMQQCLRKSDTLARFGGDEFLLLLSGPDSIMHAHKVSEKILASLSKSFKIDCNQMYISASIGIVHCPKDGLDTTSLLKRADLAMYEAKANGKNQYKTFTECASNHKSSHRLTLEKDIWHAIEKEELLLNYQPIIDLSSMQIIGVESLLRWHHYEKGMVPPAEFIPIAETTCLIQEMGKWVLEEACQQCKHWNEVGHDNFHVAVNVSANQLKNEQLPAFISDLLSKYSLQPNSLDIEITESVFYAEDAKSVKVLNQLSEIGVRLLLDDFGTGYSSLSTLHGLPFDVIKIDRSFMDVTHERKLVMVQTIINMAKNFKMVVIAEGIEDKDTLKFLIDHGCEYGQGYIFSKPVTAEQLDIKQQFDIDSSSKLIMKKAS